MAPKERNVQTFKIEFKEIVGKWHCGTRQGNHGDPGNTLEDLLGVEENNLKIPDYGNIELKVSENEGGSLITLFHKEPSPHACVPKLIKALGWRHAEAGKLHPENELSFRSTTYGHRHSSRGFTVSFSETQMLFVFDPDKVDRSAEDNTGVYKTYQEWLDDITSRNNPNYADVFPIFYDLKDLKSVVEKKLSNTMLVFYDKKREKNMNFYRYTDAFLLSSFSIEKFTKLIQSGKVVLDFDARSKKNHGTKLRVNKEYIAQMFDRSEIIAKT